MEEIEENQTLGNEEQIQPVDTRLGPEQNRIKEIILSQIGERQNREDDKTAEKRVSLNIKDKLDDEFGGNWNVIIGEVFVSVLGLLPQDRFGHFKHGNTNILVFETSSERIN